MTSSTKKALPPVPFRVMTDEERDRTRAYLRDNPSQRYDDEIWMQTANEARKVIEAIRRGGFVVGGELAHGDGMDGYGVLGHVYSKSYPEKEKVKAICDFERVIGSVGIWEYGGFISNPVSVWYQNMKLIDDSLELRNYLTAQGISFRDNLDVEEVRKRIGRLEAERQDALGLLKKLEGVQLRGD